MNVPKLRFKEFDGEWEEKDIIHIAQDEKSAVKIGPFGSQLRKEYLQSAGLYKVYGQENVFNNDFSQGNRFLNEERFNLLKSSEIISGDIVISMMGTIGKIAEVPSNIQVGIMDSHLIRIRLDNQKYLNSFFIQVMNSTILKKQIEKLSVGSIMSGLSSKVIKTLQFPYTKIEEQKKISKFLNLLDKKIQLQQQKIDLLQEQKKGFLQKMFPKAGETQPEMRFDGFTGEWEECKLREVANHRGGTAIEKYFDDNGDYKVISIGSYGLDNKYVDQNIRAISNDITDSRLVKKGELTMVLNDKTSNGTIIGRSLLIEKDNEFVVNQRTEIISPKTAFDSAFAYVTLNGPFREKVRKIVQGGTQIYVNYSAVENLNLLVPQIEEQKKIGSFFKQLDNVITFQQQKLELFQKQKDGFMQQMFI